MNDKESIPQLNELLYTMKLRTGDEVLFTMVSEEEEGLVIESPIKVSVIAGSTDGELYSELITQRWMLFSTDNTIFIPFIDIIAYSQMKESAYKIYLNAVKRYCSDEPDSDPSESSFIAPSTNTIQ